MKSFRVVCGSESPIAFEEPQAVLRACDLDGALAALVEAEEALDAGAWIAGYLSYELGAALADVPVHRGTMPLLVLGVFDAPQTIALPRSSSATVSPLIPDVTRAAYADAIASIQRAIYDGDVYQVNYTVPFRFHLDGDAYAWWASVAHATGARYQAFVEDDGCAIASWSPELFLRFDGERIEARPMKGTARREESDALASTKNRAEHVMIVDLLRNDLRQICEDVRVDRLFDIESYPTLATMTSTISGIRRPGLALVDLLRATFPCGSITGAPKRAAIAHIGGLERRARDAYCGSIGFLSPRREGWWNVAIRTAQIEANGCARFDVGGGIVADSTAGEEWAEIGIKSAFLRAHAMPPELLETFACDAANEVLEAHVQRLGRTAELFGIAYDEDALRAEIETHRTTLCEEDAILRVRVKADGSFVIVREARERFVEPVRLCLAETRVRHDDPFLLWKTAWRPAHRAAAQTARDRGCFEALLCNERGELTEGSRTNLFIERAGMLWTPPLESGLLPGILRRRLLEEGQVHEMRLTADDLASADAIYVGNSARGLLRARMV